MYSFNHLKSHLKWLTLTNEHALSALSLLNCTRLPSFSLPLIKCQISKLCQVAKTFDPLSIVSPPQLLLPEIAARRASLVIAD